MIEILNKIGLLALPLAFLLVFILLNKHFISEEWKWRKHLNIFSFILCSILTYYLYNDLKIEGKIENKAISVTVYLNGEKYKSKYVIINGNKYKTDDYCIIKIKKIDIHTEPEIFEATTHHSWKINENNEHNANLFLSFTADKILLNGNSIIDLYGNSVNYYDLEFLRKDGTRIFIDQNTEIKATIDDFPFLVEKITDLDNRKIRLFATDNFRLQNGMKKLKIEIRYGNFSRTEHIVDVNIWDSYIVKHFNKNHINWSLSKGSHARIDFFDKTKEAYFLEVLTKPKGYITLDLNLNKIQQKINKIEFVFSRNDRMSSPHIYIGQYLFTIGGDYGETITQHAIYDGIRKYIKFESFAQRLIDNTKYRVMIKIKDEEEVTKCFISIRAYHELLNEHVLDTIEFLCKDIYSQKINNFSIGSTYTYKRTNENKDVFSSVRFYQINKI